MSTSKNHDSKTKKGCSIRHISIIIPAVVTVLLIIIYTFVIQGIYSDETLTAGMSRNTERADSVYSDFNHLFTRSDFTDLMSEDAMKTYRYIELQQKLNDMRKLKAIRYLYTAGLDSNGTIVYIVDGLDLDAEDFAVPGTPLENEMLPFIESALSGQTVYSHDIVDTTWGHIYTACYPITGNDGEIIGALCVEMDMESVYKSISASNNRLLIMTVIAVVLIVLLTVPIHIIRQKHKMLENEHNTRLRDTLRMVQEREMILEALAIDYDSVYLCDLEADTTKIFKENRETYAPSAYELLGDHADSYSFRMTGYFENFVEKDSAPGLTEKLNNQNLIEYFRNHSHLTCRFKVKPNPTGHVFVECKIVPVKSDEGFKIVMGFHYIDEIIEEQELQKSRLENALRTAENNNEIISAIAKIYQMIYYIDLRTNSYETIAAGLSANLAAPASGSADNLLEFTLQNFVAPEWRSEMKEFLDLSTITERLHTIDTVTTECQGNSGRWYRARYITKNTDENGNVIGLLYVARDITNEKQQELELKQRLKESAEEAERANASKTDFLRRMSHDVRTPINGIRGMIEIANYYPNDMKKQKECRDKIWDSTGHLLSLVNNILDMNKLESGKIVLQHEPFDLVKVLSETDNIAEMQAIEHNIKFISDDNPSHIVHRHLVGSETHLKQILLNFTSNAVKYNREGGSVTVKCREISSDERTATFRFTCEDTGIGMSKEFQQHAFEPFAQEEKAVTTHYAGSGLGLSIAKQLVELMGGTLELDSQENRGTTVSFTMTFDIDPTPSNTDDEEAALAGISMKGVKVLLAEDNDLNAEIASFLLEKYEISVTRAENGEKAVELFEASSPGDFDVIFMDVMMPVMGGLDATRKIRSLDRADAKTIPIFAMTANAFVDDIQRSLDAGMNEHLTKPLQESDIIMTLSRYVKK